MQECTSIMNIYILGAVLNALAKYSSAQECKMMLRQIGYDKMWKPVITS